MLTPFEFDIESFRGCYPGLTEDKISDAELTACWEELCALLGDGQGNFPYSPEKIKPIVRSALCHLATLRMNNSDQPGRVTSATEGSVSVSFEVLQAKTETAQWWNQTRCGALFWAMTLPQRSGPRIYPGLRAGIY